MPHWKINDDLSKVLKTSIPLVVVELVASLYSLTDTYFIRGLGEEALAALGISGYIIMLLQTFNVLYTVPVLVYTSQSIGAGRCDIARKTAGELLVYGYITILTLSMLWYVLCEKIVQLQSGASGVVLQYATEYLQIRVVGFIVLFTTMTLDSMIIATGKTTYSMIANTIGLVLNAILDPLLIYGYLGFPRMNIVGAAVATVISNTLTIPIQLYYLSKLSLLPSLTFSTSAMGKIIDLGLPAFIERIMFALGNNVYAGVIARLGSTVMAAHNIGLRIESLIFMPGFAFSLTASTLVGRYVGSGDLDKAKTTGWRVVKIGSIVMGGLGVIVGLTGYYLAEPFSPSEEVRRLSSIYLVLAGFSELGLGLAMVTGGAIRGAGNTRIPMAVNILSLIFIRITLSIFLISSLGSIGPWTAMFIDVYVRGIILALLYKNFFHTLAKKLV